MSTLHEGKLRLRPTKKGKQLVLDVPNRDNPEPAKRLLSSDLQDLPDLELDQLEIEYETEKGQVLRVRRKGQPYQPPASAGPPPAEWKGHAGKSHGGSFHGGKPKGSPQANPAHQQPATLTPAFHNPYNFIPAPPRKVDDPDLGDAWATSLAGHHRYDPNRWTGDIAVKMTTRTPLLVLDAATARMDRNKHKTFDVRVNADRSAYVAPTSVKGMLRPAYEAVTNSRMSVFEKHDERLAYRMEAGEGLSLVPARIDGGKINLLLGKTSDIPKRNPANRRWQVPDNGLLYAAWLHMYGRSRKSWGRLAEHGKDVWAYVVRWHHGPFQFWNVVELRDGRLPQPKDKPQDDRPESRNASPIDRTVGEWVFGYVCVTQQNMEKKHDERVFFVDPSHPKKAHLSVPLEEKEKKAWQELIRNYQEEHDAERKKGLQGPPASKARWSRHVTGGPPECGLSDRTLCYARVEPSGTGYQVVALYPVMIARKLFQSPPADLLHHTLKPATSFDQLSPADRVFGWASHDGHGAYRGHFRIGPVRCESEDALDIFEGNGVPLAILGQPKPQQVRFYGAQNGDGTPFQDGTEKSAGYRSNQGLRGRKVYPYQGEVSNEYWENPDEDRTQRKVGERFQEYRRPHEPETRTDDRGNDEAVENNDGTFRLLEDESHEQRDDQNRSITSWVKPEEKFSFTIHVTNLTGVELGALLWLLTLDEGQHFRLGGGKPLGFGSVRLDLERVTLHTGEVWAEFYKSLSAVEPEAQPGKSLAATDGQVLEPVLKLFRDAVEHAYGNGRQFEEVSFIKAFVQAAKGFDDGLPVHYPRKTISPHPEGKNYEWFVANERKDGPKMALRSLEQPDPGLPLLK